MRPADLDFQRSHGKRADLCGMVTSIVFRVRAGGHCALVRSGPARNLTVNTIEHIAIKFVLLVIIGVVPALTTAVPKYFGF